MEFYRFSKIILLPLLLSFNSQRDGILHNVKRFKRVVCRAFQFPTGWNSTTAVPLRALGFRCFNSQRDGILRFALEILGSSLGCFNSQRDGILHTKNASSESKTYSFNSQRDGILPYFRSLNRHTVRVSIPNGMEFYYLRIFATSSP